jgi:hypothetical protein
LIRLPWRWRQKFRPKIFARVTPRKTVILKSWVCAVCCAETQDAHDNLQKDSMERSIDRPSVQRHVPALRHFMQHSKCVLTCCEHCYGKRCALWCSCVIVYVNGLETMQCNLLSWLVVRRNCRANSP